MIIAEIELPHKDKVFEKPYWLTFDRRYSNATLTKLPFQKWPDISEQEYLICGKLKPMPVPWHQSDRTGSVAVMRRYLRSATHFSKGDANG